MMTPKTPTCQWQKLNDLLLGFGFESPVEHPMADCRVCRVALGDEAHNIVFFAGMEPSELSALLRATFAATLDTTGERTEDGTRELPGRYLVGLILFFARPS